MTECAREGAGPGEASALTSIVGHPYAWMLIAAAAFSAMAEFAKALAWQQQIDWRLIVLARSGLALMFAIALVRGIGARLVVWRPLSLWMRSLAGSVSMVCTFYALADQHLPVSEVLTISNVFPVWVALLSWPMLGEVPGLPVWGAIVLGVCGVALVEQPHAIQGNVAAFVVLGGSVFTAVAMLGLHRLRQVDPRAIVAHFSGVATVVCAAMALAGGRDVIEQSYCDFRGATLLLGMGISATIGQVFLTKAFAAGPPAKVSVVALSQVPMVMALDMLFWGRRFDWVSLAGITLVVAPTAWLLLSQPAAAGPKPELD